MIECLFCKIIKGEIPCTKLYEDDKVLAFLDIAPVNHGHTLVIPKKHSTNIFDIEEEDLHAVWDVIKKLAPIITKVVKAEGLNINSNHGKIAGQLVSHAHFHIIPRMQGDGLKHWSHSKYKNSEDQKIAREIRDLI